MNIIYYNKLLILLISILLVIISSLSINTYIRLKQLIPIYKNEDTFSVACRLSKEHIIISYWISITILILSIIILFLTSKNFFNIVY
jgi:hypothetical protein